MIAEGSSGASDDTKPRDLPLDKLLEFVTWPWGSNHFRIKTGFRCIICRLCHLSLIQIELFLGVWLIEQPK